MSMVRRYAVLVAVLALTACAPPSASSTDAGAALDCRTSTVGGGLVASGDTAAAAVGSWLARSGRADLVVRPWIDAPDGKGRQYLVRTTSGRPVGALGASPRGDEPGGWTASLYLVCTS